MKLINHQEKKTPMLMIIPMIDIIFFLLVFFMMSMLTMVVQKTMPLHLPAASSSSIDTEKTLPIAVDARGQVFLEDTPVTLEMLAEKLAVEKAQNEKLIIVLRGDRVADYDGYRQERWYRSFEYRHRRQKTEERNGIH